MARVDADVLIAGGGLAAQRCCETLRRLGFDGRIVVLCEEPRHPYDRPPLSKTVLTENSESTDGRGLAFKSARWYVDNDVELMTGVAACELDAMTHTVGLRDGHRPGSSTPSRLRYRALVIATGSRPRRLPALPLGSVVHELRTHDDALRLRGRLRDVHGGRLVVLGAGLIGMEVASSARALGLEVTMIEAGTTPLQRALPPALGHWIAGLHRSHGVDVRLERTVTCVTLRRDTALLECDDGTIMSADTVLVAAGTGPATEWLADSGLGPGPILTDAGGRTSRPQVYAAGDVACYPDPYLGEPVCTPHWEAAARQGAAVARAIAGAPLLPPAPPMFWSDQYGRRIQLIGHAPHDCRIEIEGDPANGAPFTAWITNARTRRPAGVLLVDRPNALPAARRWIANGHTDTQDSGSPCVLRPPIETTTPTEV